MRGRKSASGGSKVKELHWVNCSECGCKELFENYDVAENYDSSKMGDFIFNCRRCKAEAEISRRQLGMEGRLAEIEKTCRGIVEKQNKLNEKQAEIRRDLELKVETKAVEQMFEKLSVMETAQAELVVKVDELKGEWPTLTESKWTLVTPKNTRKLGGVMDGGRVSITSMTKDQEEGPKERQGISGGTKPSEVEEKVPEPEELKSRRKAGTRRSKGASAKLTRRAGVKNNVWSRMAIRTKPKRTVSKTGQKLQEVEGRKEVAGTENKGRARQEVGVKTNGRVGTNMRVIGAEGATRTEIKGTGVSFKEICKNLKQGTVVLLGDSMVRGIGAKLERDNSMFSTTAQGGARIESISWSLRNKQVKHLNDTSHLIVMVGTNNIKNEGTEAMMKKYGKLVEVMKDQNCRKLSLVGILTRGDEDKYLEGKRTAINVRLSQLCERNGVEFVDPRSLYEGICTNTGRSAERRVVETRVLDRWGLHLSEWGQDQVARLMFKHCVKYLN